MTAHPTRSRLVEHHVALQEIRAMEEFVDNHPRQLHPVEVEQVGEERVIEEADDREPPEIRLKRIARRRHDNPYDRALVDLGYGLIRAANVELQVVRGEFSNFKYCFKFCTNVGGQITVGKLPADRLAVP